MTHTKVMRDLTSETGSFHCWSWHKLNRDNCLFGLISDDVVYPAGEETDMTAPAQLLAAQLTEEMSDHLCLCVFLKAQLKN